MKTLLIAVLLAIASVANAQTDTLTVPAPWDQEILNLAATLPIQDEGRIKPLDTYAQFTLLKLNGVRRFETETGEKLTPIAWLLNCLYYPETTKSYRHFIVDSDETVVAIGVATHGGKRDRFSYNELLPGREKLLELGTQYNERKAKDPNSLTRLEQQVLNLANNIYTYELLIHYLDFTRTTFSVPGDTALAKAFPEPEGVGLYAAVTRVPEVMMLLRQQSQSIDRARLDAEVAAIATLLEEANTAVMPAVALAIIPPEEALQKEWLTPAEIMTLAIDITRPRTDYAKYFGMFERLTQNRDNRPIFREELKKLHTELSTLATARGEYNKIPLEVHFYKAKYIFLSQWMYVLSFLLVAVSWLFPQSRAIHRLVPISVAVPTVLLVIGIALRCIIRSRPPVSTLYETILFITAVVVIVALIIEYMNRQRIAVALGAFLGAVGMFLAYRYEVKEGVDTMPSLVAVLDTNFWLSTHVTTVTAGYAAGLLCGAIAHIYIFGKLFGLKKYDPQFYRSLARMNYGVLCFCLLFATVGTILGGIWANDSWGRFWGWDPKENGALMIVLWSLVLLHAKMGRYIADLGMAMGAVFLAMIVTFSWWGVNLLGVGLHSYGFTSGIMNILAVYWATECLVILLGALVAWRARPPRGGATSGGLTGGKSAPMQPVQG